MFRITARIATSIQLKSSSRIGAAIPCLASRAARNGAARNGANEAVRVICNSLLLGLKSGCLVLLFSVAPLFAQQPDPLDVAMDVLMKYEWGPDRDALHYIDAAILVTHNNVEARQNLEDRLLSVLETDAPRAAKDFCCRKLCAIGTDRSVPVVAGLLSDKKLAHMARAVLESIESPAATLALRQQLLALDGDLKIGVINSLGRLQDADVVPALDDLLTDGNLEIVGASVVALQRIGTKDAVRVILDFRSKAPQALATIVNDARLRTAQACYAGGQIGQAAEIYQSLQKDSDEHIRLAAFRGLLLVDPESANRRIVEAIGAGDERMRLYAIETVRQQADSAHVEALLSGFSGFPLVVRTGLLDALRDLDHAAVRKAALTALGADNAVLREAALRALQISGEASDVYLIAEVAARSSGGEHEAAAECLERLQSKGVDQQLLELLSSAGPGVRIELLRAIAARRIEGAGPGLLRMAQSGDTAVRLEALRALQVVNSASLAPQLIPLLVAAADSQEREFAERAVWASCSRIEPSSDQAAPIIAALDQAKAETEIAALLPALGRVGGVAAAAEVRSAMQSPNKTVRDAAVRALCNWPDLSMSKEMLSIARSGAEKTHQIWAIRAYARVIARAGKEHPQETFEGLHDVMKLATRTDEKRLILTRLTAARVPGALDLAVSCIADEQLKDAAIDAAVELAEGMKDSYPEQAKKALQRVVQHSDDAELNLYIAKLIWNMELKNK